MSAGDDLVGRFKRPYQDPTIREMAALAADRIERDAATIRDLQARVEAAEKAMALADKIDKVYEVGGWSRTLGAYIKARAEYAAMRDDAKGA